MNKHIYIVLGSFLGTLLSLSCTDKVPVQLDIQGADGYVQIYMPSASRLDNSKSVYIQEEKQTFNVSAYYGGPKYPSQDLFIEFEFRPDLVADYNAKNGTDYAAMPEGSYAMPARRLHRERHGKKERTVNILRTEENPPAPRVRKDVKRIEQKRPRDPDGIHAAQSLNEARRRLMDQEKDDCGGERRFQQSLRQR